jgi:hypothetical protein
MPLRGLGAAPRAAGDRALEMTKQPNGLEHNPAARIAVEFLS